jgi:hypothetical protein
MSPISVVGALQTLLANMPTDQRQPLADAVACIVDQSNRLDMLEWFGRQTAMLMSGPDDMPGWRGAMVIDGVDVWVDQAESPLAAIAKLRAMYERGGK